MVRLLVSERMSAQRCTAEITFPLLWKSVIRRKKTILVSAVMGACLASAGLHGRKAAREFRSLLPAF